MVKKKLHKKNYKRLIPILILIIILLGLAVFAIIKLMPEKIQNGDTVTLDYTGYLENGEVFDTSIEAIGLESGVERGSYEPLTFTVGNEEVIPGFEEQALGMKVDEEKTFDVPPDKAYGESLEDLIKEFNRNMNITRVSNLSIENYTNFFGAEPKIGEEVHLPNIPWDLKIIDIKDNMVFIESLLEVGYTIEFPGLGWETEVVEVTDELIFLRQNPEIGNYISAPRNQKFAKIVSVDDDSFLADANHPLAGKTLTYKVKILNITKSDIN